MIPIRDIEPGRAGDTLSLQCLAREASDFLLEHAWCQDIMSGHLDRGWEGVLAVFYFEIEPALPHVEESLWVIVGDLPPAYICTENANGAQALKGYVAEMQRWVDAVRNGGPVDELIPVNVPPTPQHADMLDSRLEFIRSELLFHMSEELVCD